MYTHFKMHLIPMYSNLCTIYYFEVYNNLFNQFLSPINEIRIHNMYYY